MQVQPTQLHPAMDARDRSPAQFLTVEQLVARWFGEGTANTAKTNLDNVRELFSSGVLPGRKIGRRWYVHLSAVQAYERGRDDPSVMRHPDSRLSA